LPWKLLRTGDDEWKSLFSLHAPLTLTGHQAHLVYWLYSVTSK